jgi:hypothetical protein
VRPLGLDQVSQQLVRPESDAPSTLVDLFYATQNTTSKLLTTASGAQFALHAVQRGTVVVRRECGTGRFDLARHVEVASLFFSTCMRLFCYGTGLFLLFGLLVHPSLN